MTGPDPQAPARASTSEVLRTPGIRASFLLVLFAFAGFSLLLPVVPLAVVRNGGSDVLAGATTGVFMASTVVVQLLTPRVIARVGYRAALFTGSALLGLPSALLLVGDQPVLVLAVCAIRGAGFGMMTVAGSALVAELAPVGSLGRATSLVGLAVGLSEAVFLPAGLALNEHVGFAAVVWPATALGAAGLLAAARLPGVRPAPRAETGEAHMTPRDTVSRLWGPFLVMLAVSVPYGTTSTFLSPALDLIRSGTGAVVAGVALGLLGAAVIAGRTFAGTVSDRRGPGTLVAPGLILAGIGMAGVAVLLAVEVDPWWHLLPCLVFGLGFGAVQNEALVGSFERVPRSELGTASASWNISFDAGTGTGALVLGAATGSGFPVLFVCAAVVVGALGTPVAATRRSRAERSRVRIERSDTTDRVIP